MSEVIVNGPTNIPVIELSELMPGEGFINPKNKRLYVRLYNDPDGIECFRFTPSLGTASLERRLMVRRANINVNWSFA